MLISLACVPICGILMGIGYFMCPEVMQGKEVVGVIGSIGAFLVKAGLAILDNIPLIFAVGIGVGMSDDNDGVGGMAALVAWLIITNVLGAEGIKTIYPKISGDTLAITAFDKIKNPFIGILCGIIGSSCYNRFKTTKLPDWLGFFSGKRSVTIMAAVMALGVAVILMFIWPVFFFALVSAGNAIAKLGNVGAGIYATLNRLLIPSGLHHALNNVFWFDTIGIGDLTKYWAGKTSADVGWSLGMYMSGFFPCIMFGTAGASLAIVLCSKPENRKKVIGLLLGSAICAFVCGITEPFEFSFMFLCPPLFVIYAVLYGVMTVITLASGFRGGFSFSAGALDLVFSSSLPAAQKTWMIIPLGLLAFALFFGCFYLYLKKSKRELFSFSDKPAAKIKNGEDKYATMAKSLLKALGGTENLTYIDCCVTRLRLEINDASKIDKDAIMASGAKGVINIGNKGLQVVIGTDVQFAKDALKDEYNRQKADHSESDVLIKAPVSGKLIEMKDIPDEVFSEGILGPCCGIYPTDGEITSPIDGEVIQIAETLHSICISNGEYDVLIHAGIDTVKLKGKGFTPLVNLNDKVKIGQPILKMDIDTVKNEGFSPIVITVLTNAETENVNFKKTDKIERSEKLLDILKYTANQF